MAGDVVPGFPGVVAAHLLRLRLPLHGRVLAEETGDSLYTQGDKLGGYLAFVDMNCRATIHVVPNLPLTPKQRLHFSACASTFVLMSTGEVGIKVNGHLVDEALVTAVVLTWQLKLEINLTVHLVDP